MLLFYYLEERKDISRYVTYILKYWVRKEKLEKRMRDNDDRIKKRRNITRIN